MNLSPISCRLIVYLGQRWSILCCSENKSSGPISGCNWNWYKPGTIFLSCRTGAGLWDWWPHGLSSCTAGFILHTEYYVSEVFCCVLLLSWGLTVGKYLWEGHAGNFGIYDFFKLAIFFKYIWCWIQLLPYSALYCKPWNPDRLLIHDLCSSHSVNNTPSQCKIHTTMMLK